MKTSFRVPVILFLITLSIKGHAQKETYTFDLRQALSFALENNIQVQQALLSKKQADYKISEVKSAGLPQVEGVGTLQNFPNLPTQLLPGEIIGMPGTQVPVQFGSAYTLSGGFEASQLVYNQSFLTGLKAAKSSEELYTLLQINTEEEVIYQVGVAYYQAFQLEAQVKVLENNLGKFNELEKLLKVQYQNDMVTKTEYNRLQVNRANLSTQLQAVKTQHVQQKNYLKLLLGLSIGQELILQQNLPLKDPTLTSLQFEKLQPIQLKVLEKQTELNVLNRKNIGAGYYPTLSVFGQHSWQAQRNEFNFFDANKPWFQQTIIGVQLQVPIFDGLAKHYRIAQSKIDIQNMQLDFVNASRNTDLAYENAREQLVNSLSSVETQRSNKQLAQEVYVQTQELYKQQVSNLTDLLDAETALREAEINYNKELLTFKKAELDLLKAQGQLKQLITQ